MTDLILAFDTSGPFCAAALLQGGKPVGSIAEDMTKGQAERLMPLLEDLLTAHAATWADLTAIGVGVGPGNFTGIRVAVSAARGLALGLDIPAVGVSGFDARAHLADDTIPAVPAPREQVYVQIPGQGTQQIPLTEAEKLGPLFTGDAPADLAIAIAQITAKRWQATNTPPAPLYIRAANAAPSTDVPPKILDA